MSNGSPNGFGKHNRISFVKGKAFCPYITVRNYPLVLEPYQAAVALDPVQIATLVLLGSCFGMGGMQEVPGILAA